MSNPSPRDIRVWAKTNGYNIGARGRISKEIRDAYLKSQLVSVQHGAPATATYTTNDISPQ